MKGSARLLSAVLALVLLLVCSGCGADSSAAVKLYSVNGFAQLGLQKLLKDHAQTYENTVCSEQEAYDAVLEGKADIALCSLACAVRLYDETQSGIRIAAVCAGQKFYAVTAGAPDSRGLKSLENQTVYISGEGDTQSIIDYVLRSNAVASVSLNIPGGYDEQAALSAARESAGSCVLSEPNASFLELSDSRFSCAVCINDEWDKICDTGNTPVTCCAVVSSDFAQNHRGELEAFLSAYQISLNYLYYSNSSTSINELTASGFFPSVDYASAAIKRSGAEYLSGDEMQFAVAATLEALAQDGKYANAPVPDLGIFLE